LNTELPEYTHPLYESRELAMERQQYEAEQLGAEGIVGVTVHEKQHGWGGTQTKFSWRGETIEFFVVGTAVVAFPQQKPVPVPTLVIEVSR
ncbi:MAG: heavy metal-binding domain-containing protein, partial [Polyangiaceae bacterium]